MKTTQSCNLSFFTIPTTKNTKSQAKHAAAAVHRKPKLSEEEQLFNQVTREIEERQKFLADMAALGDHSHDERVTKEIEERIADMNALNQLIQQSKR